MQEQNDRADRWARLRLVFAGCGGPPSTPGVGFRIPEEPAMEPASPATDRAALEALYRGTAGPSWGENTSWLTVTPLNEWYGVRTDATRRVTALNLSYNPRDEPLDSWIDGMRPLGPNLSGLSGERCLGAEALRATDRAVLEALCRATDGNNQHTGWLSETPVEPWRDGCLVRGRDAAPGRGRPAPFRTGHPASGQRRAKRRRRPRQAGPHPGCPGPAATYLAEVPAAASEAKRVILDGKGAMLLQPDYRWDGASGLTIDTVSARRAALAHDACYTMLRQRRLGPSGETERKLADLWLWDLLLEDGMWRFRAAYWHWAVCRFGASAAGM